MAVNTVSATMERRAKGAEREARVSGMPTFRSVRHGAPAATYSDRNRCAEAVASSGAGRLLFETWGWG